MPLVGIDKILKPLADSPRAVGSFNICTLDMLEGVVRAAEETRGAVIVGFAERHSRAVNPWAISGAVLARLQRSPASVVFHFDHASSLEGARTGIEMGCTSVMIDGSSLPLDQNIELTRSVVEIAHPRGVAVEGEIGGIGGIEGEIAGDNEDVVYTRPEDAARFVRESGVDLLAIALGTVHGLYRRAPNLRFDILEQVRRSVSVPLVLHGGTGICDDDMRRLIHGGIRKINVFTEISIAVAETIRGNLLSSESLQGAAEALAGCAAAVAESTKRLMILFDSTLEQPIEGYGPAPVGDAARRS